MRSSTGARGIRNVSPGTRSHHGCEWPLSGGWTTRFYGRPEDGVHAVQMELTQSTYLATETLPFDYDDGKARLIRGHLAAVLEALERSVYQLKGTS